ncbi:hypothetical protein JQ599_09540 [Bradyrhizobium diazoefficiens]|nr:hypothetical protein [Bradyrhizobium diazoefficiens]MBR0700141.1 hypothetical protein [Bradyrhizobium diazoefficiens]MBR0768476.1 hypothetical protein [Bradyrhizobium diazoefficiens]
MADSTMTAHFGEHDADELHGVLSTRVNNGLPYLMAAARFSRLVGASEQANGPSFGDVWDELRDHATACLFMTDAAIESYANELFADAAVIFPAELHAGLDLLWSKIEKRETTFDKLDLALELRGKPKLDRKSKEFKAVMLVNRLRNELTHFKPEWSHQRKKHKSLSEELKGLFVLNPWFANEGAFPQGWVGHSCTVWAVTSAVTFLLDFEAQAGLANRTPWSAFQSRLVP